MINPITPKEAMAERVTNIPDFVIECFNKAIVANVSGKKSVVKQDEVIKLILEHKDCINLNRQDLFDKHYLDVEDMFRKAGWKVEYDKPAYYETYDAFFVFTFKE